VYGGARSGGAGGVATYTFTNVTIGSTITYFVGKEETHYISMPMAVIRPMSPSAVRQFTLAAAAAAARGGAAAVLVKVVEAAD